MSLTSEQSSLSYTNKDFNSIYRELLEYTKKLSYKWDPTASDESDPGVVLLKLAAIIGDKDSYNIDNNVLELMPASVSQLPAARQIFDQCGYTMRYYQAAEGYVSVSVKKDPPSETTETTDTEQRQNYNYVVPMFTMFCDAESSVVYSTSAQTTLKYNASQTLIPVIEGVKVEYTINNDPLITAANLDSKNRIYFTDTHVAENGIFIKNENQNNYDDWYRVDNIEIQPRQSRCYKFGLTLDGSSCYIEFPEDAPQLFGSGINITYVRTSGNSGNIAAKKLTQFYSDTKFKRYIEENPANEELVPVTTDYVSVTNKVAILNGSDPETIEDAYRNYQRVKTTFDTLVTVKDYTDYMVTSGHASNGYVCDRTNDIQHSYKVLEIADLGNINRTHVETKQTTVTTTDGKIVTIDEPAMLPYDLCVYSLKKQTTTDPVKGYNETFTLVSGVPYQNSLENTDAQFGIKSLQHNFVDFDTNKILMIKNKYSIVAHIIPRHKLSVVEQNEVKHNVIIALCEALNSFKLTFGKEVEYDLIHDTINSADPRIRAASVQYPEFKTFVVYKNDNGDIVEMRVDGDESSYTEEEKVRSTDRWNAFRAEIFAKNILAGVTPLFKPDGNYLIGVSQTDPNQYSNVAKITTETIIPLQKVGDKHTTGKLFSNENILLTAPSTVEENSFSTYTKMIYKFNNTPTAGAQYELTGDEFIAFFWKAADTDTFYKYVKYTSTTDANIICPSFTFNAKQPTNVDQTLLNRVAELGTSGSTDAVVYSQIAALSTSDVVLTGLNKVTTHKVNTVKLTSNNYQDVYWIFDALQDNNLNSSSSVVQFPWVLSTSEPDASGNMSYTYTYTLKANEYVMYTNRSRTMLELLGQGTLLELNTSEDLASIESRWTVPFVSYSEFIQKGFDAIEQWHSLAAGEDVVVTEMRQILLGSENELHIANVDNVTEVTNTPTPLPPTAVLEYVDAQGTTTSIPSMSDGWCICTTLNLNMSTSAPQELIDGRHYMTIYNAKGECLTTDPITNCFVQSDVPVTTPGGVNVDVTYLKDFNTSEKGYLGLRTFTRVTNSNDAVQYNNTSEVAIVECTSDKQSVTLPVFMLRNGQYIVQLSPGSNIEELSLSLKGYNDAELDPLYTGTTLNRLYTLTVASKSAESAQIELTVTAGLTNNTTSSKVTIQPLYKYTTLVSEEEALRTRVLAALERFDVDRACDYTTTIDDPIEDPLKADSFHNSKHRYNAYTIDQWITSNADKDLVVTTNVR